MRFDGTLVVYTDGEWQVGQFQGLCMMRAILNCATNVAHIAACSAFVDEETQTVLHVEIYN